MTRLTKPVSLELLHPPREGPHLRNGVATAAFFVSPASLARRSPRRSPLPDHSLCWQVLVHRLHSLAGDERLHGHLGDTGGGWCRV